MIKIKVDSHSQRTVIDAIQAMTLSKSRRKRVLTAAAKASVKTSRQNQRQQKTPSGKRWPARADKSKKKMQVRLAKFLTVTASDDSTATLSWRKSRSARVAAKHHYGHRERHTRAAAIKRLRNGNAKARQSA
ncbi:phage virion morphogenesis protein [Vibrio sagamiensis]|uniref:phage virion morphogenesis protein n=1 Tax=Vibrio sagamiensis TaxID=512650 RepID=UPI000586D22A|nr:phage virion morphogenesis protein [Vibrio sagamiensis]PNQ69317.1 hypothetical protein C1141_06300 [Vibrio agarivorans]